MEQSGRHIIRSRADAAHSGRSSPRHASTLCFVRGIGTLLTCKIPRPRYIVNPRLAASATATAAPAARMTAPEAGTSSCGEAPDLPAVVVAAERARAHPVLAGRFAIPSGRFRPSPERIAGGTGSRVTAPGAFEISPALLAPASNVACTARHVACHTPLAAAAIIGVAVVERVAPGEVPVVIEHGVSVVPVESPMPPAPSEASEKADPESDSP